LKIARVRTAEHDEILALVGDGSVTVIENVRVESLVDIAMARNVEALALGKSYTFDEVRFLAPIKRPTSIRDFSAFEQHTKNVVEGSGGKMNPAWYEMPIFYFSNPCCVIGDGDPVVPPKKSKLLDFELEIACIVGNEILDLDPESADWQAAIAGFMLMNDWSARDLGVKEMALLFGPAKAKDFATTFGPWLTTPDEFVIENGRFDLPMTVKVNGAVWGEGNVSDLYFSWTQILAHASADCTLYPGEVIGSGTCGSGCILELRFSQGKDAHPWLKPSDVVEISAPGLGTLTNTINAAEATP
jgi:2-keto-4-pentenoate hydratase/2-oxohepta-3-ene-1,7-dioic acid hydratase in catechol pathway